MCPAYIHGNFDVTTVAPSQELVIYRIYISQPLMPISQHRVAKSYPIHTILCSVKLTLFTNYEAFVFPQLGNKTTFANAGGLFLQKQFKTR